MANYIINQLLENNKEFNIIFNTFKSQGKIFTFSSLYHILDEYKFDKNDFQFGYFTLKPEQYSLKSTYMNDLNLFSPYLVALHTVRAIMNKRVLDERVTKKPTIVYGKQYLTKNFPNIYDCISVWIETEKYIIDPVLAIVVDKSIKDKMFYNDIHRRIDYVLDFKKNSPQFSLSGLYKFELDKYFIYRNYKVPKQIRSLFIDKNNFINNCNQIRSFLKAQNPKFYNKLMMLIATNKVVDLSRSDEFQKFVGVKICESSNPNLTFEKALKKGLNYGRCGLFAKLYSNKFLVGREHTYHQGVCKNIVGSKNSDDGNHAWLEYDGKIIDTSLMLIIPIEYKQELGYKTFKREKVGTIDRVNAVFNEKCNVESLVLYYDVMYESGVNGSKFFKYDFTEDLADIVEENGLDYYSEKFRAECSDSYEDIYTAK